jgi:diaminohydroxyphosphoribosylaminopyrimidine deaminase/5-amino-6-(5-phosphoribosylamino)uracil reductase
MNSALFHAERGRGRTSPNPTVGAIVVSAEGVVVGHGCTEPAGRRHAEIVALDMAGSLARGGMLFCTLEPCSHVGRTGPCVERIVEAGVMRVVASVEDPNPLVSGQGFAYLRTRGVSVDVGLGAARAIQINQAFFTLMRERRPFVVLKAAMSADGYIAEAPGRRTWLTSAAADRHAHVTRAEIDAIAVGVTTVIVDDPLLTPRGVYRESPLTRVIFDRTLRTPPTARVLSTGAAGPVIIVTGATGAADTEARARLEDRGAIIEVVEGDTLRAGIERLGERQIGSLLLEGGSGVHRAAWDEGLVDYVRLYITPHRIGPQGLAFLGGATFSTAALIERRVRPLGPDVLIEGYVHGPH